MYNLFVSLLGVDPVTLTTHSQTVVVLAACVVICSGVLFFYRCCDRIFLR